MAKQEFTWSNALLRFFAALILVFASYNPEGHSYFHWAIQPLLTDIHSFSVLKGFVGVVLLIGWSIFLRATLRSLGPFGILLAFAFFGMLVWLIVDLGVVPVDDVRAVTYLTQVVLCAILAAGLSWSHVRRRISGQRDVDDVEED